MTALCAGNGPSGPLPNTPLIQTFLAGALSDILVAEGMGWAASLAAGLGVLSFDLTTFCATDPPPLPNIDAARIAGYFNPLNGQGAAQLLADFTDLIGHFLWFKTCQCITGTQPTPPAPLPQPPGYQTDNPKLTTPTGTPCSGEQILGTPATFNPAGTFVYDNANWFLFPQGGQWATIAVNTPVATTAQFYPLTWTFTWKATQGGPALGTAQLTRTAPDAIFRTTKDTVTIPPGTTYPVVTVHSDNAPNASFEVDASIFIYCTAPPPAANEPCCPPDPILEQLIAQVLRLEQQILDSLGGSPNYTPGAQHVGRTGSASLSVNGLRGVAVHVTTGTPTTPLLPGNPPYQWDLGWMSVLTGDGMIEEKRITRQDQVWLPVSMPLATTFGYFLNPGVVATFTELVPA